jgi:hypothetical protein
MAITDADQLVEIRWRLIEDAGFSSTLWTLSEIAALFQQRQDRFNRDTFFLLAHQPIAAVAGTEDYTLPDDWIATQRVTWKTLAGAISPLTPVDRFGMANLFAADQLPPRPIAYDDQSAGIGVLEIGPVPTVDGTLTVLYASTLETLHFDPLAPDLFDIPDDFIPYLTYGVLSDLLAVTCPAQPIVSPAMRKASRSRRRFSWGFSHDARGALVSGTE